MTQINNIELESALYRDRLISKDEVNTMTQPTKRNATLTNYNKQVGEAYHVSKNGVLTVDLNDEYFQKEFMKQLKLLKKKREQKTRELRIRSSTKA